MSSFVIRPATPQDTPLIYQFILELAQYEHLEHLVTAQPETLRAWLFKAHKAEVCIGEWEGVPVGFALFFTNFSTFLGKPGLYIEDLYLRPHARKKGFGKAFFIHLAQTCLERKYGRMEWACLDWNQPSIDFYLSLGAQAQEDWTLYRLGETDLEALAQNA